jgi:hypothetical protein
MQEVDAGEQILSRYTLYETKTYVGFGASCFQSRSTQMDEYVIARFPCSRLYITASSAKHHRILKIDRTVPESLCVVEDQMVYDSTQLHTLLRMVDDGNRSTGGLEKILDFQFVPCHVCH